VSDTPEGPQALSAHGVPIAPEKSRFNPIFAQFYFDVPEAEKLRGLVAYGLYKIAKREWASELFEREGQSPSPEELAGYGRFWTPAQIEGKRAEAKSVLSEYADDVVEAAAPGIEKAALKRSVWRAIAYGLLANFVYTVLLIVVVIILKLAGVDLLGLAQKIKAL
jgi:hypothetical protein